MSSIILYMRLYLLWGLFKSKSYKISALLIHSVVKLNFSGLSVCLCNAPSIWRQMMSHNDDNVTFIDVTGTLYHVALNQNQDAVFIWSVDMSFILTEQIDFIFI